MKSCAEAVHISSHHAADDGFQRGAPLLADDVYLINQDERELAHDRDVVVPPAG